MFQHLILTGRHINLSNIKCNTHYEIFRFHKTFKCIKFKYNLSKLKKIIYLLHLFVFSFFHFVLGNFSFPFNLFSRFVWFDAFCETSNRLKFHINDMFSFRRAKKTNPGEILRRYLPKSLNYFLRWVHILVGSVIMQNPEKIV